MDWTIYVLRGLTSGLVKIGRSQQPMHRVRFIASTMEPVELLAAYVAPATEERALHLRFAASLARGKEWFRDDEAIREWLASLPPAARPGALTFPGPPALSRGFIDGRRATRDEADAARSTRYAELYEFSHGHPFVAGVCLPDCTACQRRTDARRRAVAKRTATLAARAA